LLLLSKAATWMHTVNMKSSVHGGNIILARSTLRDCIGKVDTMTKNYNDLHT